MATFGTFDAFTASRLGIYAAMQGLQVTGNNISNINTPGYTRQRADQVSFKAGANDRYASATYNHIGSGTLVSGISQIRDPYLDIRFRNTSADVGYTDTMLSGLKDIAAILDEIGRGGSDEETYGDGILYAQLQDLAEKLRAYSASPTADNDTLVRGSAQALCTLFNNYANRLEGVRQYTEAALTQDVTDVNEILYAIRDLNKSIRECEIHGDTALELRDERNRQIDALSEYLDIKVVYTMEDVGAGIEVEKLTIYLNDANPDPAVETDSSMLVDGLYATQLSIPDEKPVLNPYQNISDDDPDYNTYKALKDYLFLREVAVAPGDTAPEGAVAKVDEDGNQMTDEDGNALFLVGTNDPAADGIVTEENDNYSIRLGKLLDVNEKEWQNTTTTFEAVGSAAIKAVYSFGISLNGDWADGDTFKIGGNDYIIGNRPTDGSDDPNATYVPLSKVNTAAKFASYLASELQAQAEASGDPEYTISSSGTNVIFTAVSAGAVGTSGPKNEPSLSVTPANTIVDVGAINTVTDGEEATQVEDDDKGSTIDPLTGNKTTVAYYEAKDGNIYRIQVVTEYTREVALDDNDLHGSIQAQRELLTEEGEFSSDKDLMIDENAATKRGIPYYQQSFDLLAQKFAEAYNELNFGYALNQDGNYIDANGKELTLPVTNADGTTSNVTFNKYTALTTEQKKALIAEGYYLQDEDGNPVDEDGNLLVDENGFFIDEDGNHILDDNQLPINTTDLDAMAKYAVADLNAFLEDEDNGAVAMGGPLFSNRNDGDDISGITASNISISYSWSHNAVQIVPKYEVLFLDENGNKVENTTQNTNADHMITMIDKALTYNPSDLNGSDATGPLLFTGSFNDMLANMMGVLGEDEHILTTDLNLYYTTYVQLDSARESVSGVDLNDEAMNMMQYQKAYSAACRLMTVIDSVLDRLINNTGVTV